MPYNDKVFRTGLHGRGKHVSPSLFQGLVLNAICIADISISFVVLMKSYPVETVQGTGSQEANYRPNYFAAWSGSIEGWAFATG